jgi:AcrR family transcriptional regulator
MEPIRKRGEAARQRILDAAEELFFSKGINATAVEDVADAARVSKRTLYAYFDSKDDLARAYLNRLRAKPDTVDAAITHPELDPKTRLLQILADGTPGDQPLRGCAFLNAAVEEPDPDAPIHQLVTEQKRTSLRASATSPESWAPATRTRSGGDWRCSTTALPQE